MVPMYLGTCRQCDFAVLGNLHCHFPSESRESQAGALRKIHWEDSYPSPSTVPTPFPSFFLTWNFHYWETIGLAPCYSWQAQDFQMKTPTSQSECKYLSSSPTDLCGSHFSRNQFLPSCPVNHISQNLSHKFTQFRRVVRELPRPSSWNNNHKKASFTQVCLGREKEGQGPHLGGGWCSWGDGNDATSGSDLIGRAKVRPKSHSSSFLGSDQLSQSTQGS